MGSSTSKPRKGHEHPKHLPKVGSPENDAWGQQQRLQNAFGSSGVRIVLMVIVMMAVVGLVLLAF